VLHKLTEVFGGIVHVTLPCVMIDVDECAMNIDNCSQHANCTNTPGSFNCTCHNGYSGDGITCPGNEWTTVLYFRLFAKLNGL